MVVVELVSSLRPQRLRLRWIDIKSDIYIMIYIYITYNGAVNGERVGQRKTKDIMGRGRGEQANAADELLIKATEDRGEKHTTQGRKESSNKSKRAREPVARLGYLVGSLKDPKNGGEGEGPLPLVWRYTV